MFSFKPYARRGTSGIGYVEDTVNDGAAAPVTVVQPSRITYTAPVAFFPDAPAPAPPPAPASKGPSTTVVVLGLAALAGVGYLALRKKRKKRR